MGVVLLSTALGAMLSMPFSGWLIIRIGSRKVGLFSVYMYCALVPFIPIVFNLVGLVGVFFLLGVSAGMLRRCYECTGGDDRTKMGQTDHDLIPCFLQYRYGTRCAYGIVLQQDQRRPVYPSFDHYSVRSCCDHHRAILFPSRQAGEETNRRAGVSNSPPVHWLELE